jgi:hypothetical protein
VSLLSECRQHVGECVSDVRKSAMS